MRGHPICLCEVSGSLNGVYKEKQLILLKLLFFCALLYKEAYASTEKILCKCMMGFGNLG